MNSKKNSCRGNYMRKYGNSFFQVQNANYIRICGPIDTENDTLPNTPTRDQESSSNPITSHFEAARRRTSVSRFYTDHGPREDWDSPLNKVTFMCPIALFTKVSTQG